MTVHLPAYCTREEVQYAIDMKPSDVDYPRIDRAIVQARESVDYLCHRRFYNVIETHEWDYPNYQRAYPWRIWLDEAELADVTVNVPVVTSGGTVIPAADIMWRTGGSWNYGPPYSAIELDRSTNAAFGVGQTPQQDVKITGTFGYWTKTFASGTITANITDTVGTTVSVSNSTSPGVGDIITIDSENMLVQDRAFTDTTDTQSSGCTTAAASDNALTPSGGTFYAGEVLLLDSEQMLVKSVSGSVLTVKRAYNGTVLATHSSAKIYAPRSLTVTRGDFGTTAATHTSGATVNVNEIPALVKELAIGEALNILLQETSGFARQVGEPPAGHPATGGSLPDLRAQVVARYGRKNRKRVI